MYRSSSPVFDASELSALRRVKPLPKRRRTSTSSDDPASETSSNDIIPPLIEHLESLKAKIAIGASVDELRPHAESLTAYLPMGAAGVEERLLRQLEERDARAKEESLSEDEHGDGDYVDHLQQPGNTKKRKVPAHVIGSPRGPDRASAQAGGDDEAGEGSIGEDGNGERGAGGDGTSTFTVPLSMLARRRGRLSAATVAGLKHKELLKSRKRQLAAVLGALSVGDTLALDQALSTTYPLNSPMYDDPKGTNKPPRIRLSQRKGPRLGRAARHAMKFRHPDSVPLPTCQFTFNCPSATAERLAATKEEVAMLRKRFEAELAKQALKAAKMAATERRKASPNSKSARSKNSERAQRRPRTLNAPSPSQQANDKGSDHDSLGSGGKSRKSKKKKRSALANASNPHHLRNYVPSRLPNAAPQVAQNNFLSPPPLRFLAADIPPRRRNKENASVPSTQIANAADEWICALCEYKLFYGDEHEYRTAIKNRKKVLKRRRRARERAAAAASGKIKAKAPEKTTLPEEEYAEFDPSMPEEFSNSLNPRSPSWKGDPNRQAERVECQDSVRV
ncbi:hypothetical protein CCMSSC00406_0004963 [Pleurotus cornucopiae]|uniref:Uncharacterized protein n=1 Tax=Pleurotus cornucopiae TaxID=5321 RepID=A0ACB7J192_PLECO|nr:hypothetical protein CCMSSC00406_0004963 [Pleurotus cornucopiae]